MSDAETHRRRKLSALEVFAVRELLHDYAQEVLKVKDIPHLNAADGRCIAKLCELLALDISK